MDNKKISNRRMIIFDDEEVQRQSEDGWIYTYRKDFLRPCDDPKKYSLVLMYCKEA